MIKENTQHQPLGSTSTQQIIAQAQTHTHTNNPHNGTYNDIFSKYSDVGYHGLSFNCSNTWTMKNDLSLNILILYHTPLCKSHPVKDNKNTSITWLVNWQRGQVDSFLVAVYRITLSKKTYFSFNFVRINMTLFGNKVFTVTIKVGRDLINLEWAHKTSALKIEQIE